MKFQAKVMPSGNAAGIEVPADVIEALGPQARPLITVTINGHSWRSRLALMRGERLVGISAANRAASGIGMGDVIEVDLELDREPRVVDEPPDLAAALDSDLDARAAFDGLPFGLKRKRITEIEDAKSPQVRQRRIEKLIAQVKAGPPHRS